LSVFDCRKTNNINAGWLFTKYEGFSSVNLIDDGTVELTLMKELKIVLPSDYDKR